MPPVAAVYNLGHLVDARPVFHSLLQCRFVTPCLRYLRLSQHGIGSTFAGQHACPQSRHKEIPTRYLLESCTNPNTALWDKSLSIYVVHVHCLILSMSDHFVTPDASDTMHQNPSMGLRIGAPFHAGHQNRSQINIHNVDPFHLSPMQQDFQCRL